MVLRVSFSGGLWTVRGDLSFCYTSGVFFGGTLDPEGPFGLQGIYQTHR